MGIGDINEMTSSVGSNYIPGHNVNKITEHLASIRFDREAFFKGVIEAGYTKKDGSVDLKAFEKHLNRKGLSMWKMKSQKMMNNVTNELNDLLGGKYYKNVRKYSQKSILENLASKFKGFKGKYAEMYSAMTKENFWEDALNLQEKGDKKFGTEKTKKKLKWIVDGLKKKWPSIAIGTTLTTLSNLGFGKTLATVAAHATPIGYAADVATGAPMIYDAAKQVKEKVIDPKVIEPAAKKMVEGENILKQMFTPKMNEGGMMDINEMTKPLGYAHGGFEDRMSMLRKTMTDTEATRRADMATGDPEKERTSTFGTVTENNIRDVALTIARQQGDTSQGNIDLIIRQLMALTPSLEQTVGEETGYKAPKGLQSLMDKAKVMLGQKSDPMLRRDVGFERVR